LCVCALLILLLASLLISACLPAFNINHSPTVTFTMSSTSGYVNGLMTVCTRQTADELFERQLVGLPMGQKSLVYQL
jgi:hypothetical protein